MSALSTSQNITLSSWTLLTSIIKQHSLSIQERQAPPQMTALLSDQEWQNAIEGPFQQWLTMIISAYLHYRYVLMALHLQQDHPDRDNPSVQIPNAFLKKISQDDPQIYQFKLDALLKEQWAKWQELFQSTAENTISELQNINITLQDSHKHIFLTDEPICDVLKDIDSQKIKLPKNILENMNLEKYFTLKSLIAIQQSISQQRTATDTDLQKQIKLLKKHFQHISKQEKSLLQEQKNTIDQWLQPFQWNTE